VRKEVGPLLAIFFESRNLKKSDREFVLATFVYGDAAKGEYVVAEQGITTSTLSRSSTVAVPGTLQFVAEDALSRKPGLNELLDTTTVRVRELGAQNAKAEEKFQVEAAKQGRQWETARPERDEIVAKREALRKQALEKAATSDRFVYVPGMYSRNEQVQKFAELPGTFHRTIDDYDVTLALEPYPVRPSMSSVASDADVMPATKFSFTAEKNGVEKTYSVDATMLTSSAKNLTPEEIKLCESVLTSVIDGDGHPNAKDEAFQKHLGVGQIVSALSLASFAPSHKKTAAEIRGDLTREITTFMETCPAEKRERFLQTLVSSIKKHASGVPITWTRLSWGNYGKIFEEMKAVH